MLPSKGYRYIYQWIRVVWLFVLIGCGTAGSQAGLPTIAVISTHTPLLPPPITATPDLRWQTDWLHGIPCTLPCFLGITPGETSVAEALALLEQNPAIDPTSIMVRELGRRSSVIQAMWNTGVPGPFLFFTLGVTSTQVIDSINTSIPSISHQEILEGHGNDEPSIILQDILTAFGSPTHIIAHEITQAQESEPHKLMVSYSITFIYRSYGMIVDAILPDPKIKPVLTSRLRVKSPLVVPANDTAIEAILEEQGLTTVNILPWQGWHDFDFYCRNIDTGELCR